MRIRAAGVMARMRVKASKILFETSNPRHGHEWSVFRDRAGEVPEDKILVPGVVDTTTNFVEHPDLVAQRLERFTNIFGKERVMAGSDCGFGTFADQPCAGDGDGHEDIDIEPEFFKSTPRGWKY